MNAQVLRWLEDTLLTLGGASIQPCRVDNRGLTVQCLTDQSRRVAMALGSDVDAIMTLSIILNNAYAVGRLDGARDALIVGGA